LAGDREEIVAGAVVGDDTFPLIIGASLLLLGFYTIFVARWSTQFVQFPVSTARHKLVASVGTLVAYCLIMPYLGYTISTLIVSTGLFRVLGGYRWPVAFLIGGLTTGALFLVFVVWLAEPLPKGWTLI
jgi:putative tricarboxylic transport membrane protein